jgi:MFS family permease
MRSVTSAYAGPSAGCSALRYSLRMVTLAWVFGSAWATITGGAALTKYAQVLGLPKFGFGLLAALPYMGALLQFPASWFVERYGHRKRLLVVAGIIHRAVWFGVAAIPWVLPDANWWPSLLVLIGLSSLAGHIATPAVLAWFADIVPGRIRGRYFSRRSQAGQLVALGVTLAMGFLLDHSRLGGDTAVLRVVSIAFALAAACGVMDFLTLTPVPDPRSTTPNPRLGLAALLRGPLASREFRIYLGYSATLTFAVAYVGQFIWLYLFDVVGMSVTQANLLNVVIPLGAALACYPFWGRLIDRVGRRPVLLICGILIVNGASGWVFVAKGHWYWGYASTLLATMAWPGVDLANFSLLLGMKDASGRRSVGGAFIAINSMVSALAGALSGVFGGVLAEWLGDWQGSVCGWPLTFHGVLFIVSAVLRVLALVWVLRMHDAGSRGCAAAGRAVWCELARPWRHMAGVRQRRLAHGGEPV